MNQRRLNCQLAVFIHSETQKLATHKVHQRGKQNTNTLAGTCLLSGAGACLLFLRCLRRLQELNIVLKGDQALNQVSRRNSESHKMALRVLSSNHFRGSRTLRALARFATPPRQAPPMTPEPWRARLQHLRSQAIALLQRLRATVGTLHLFPATAHAGSGANSARHATNWKRKA